MNQSQKPENDIWNSEHDDQLTDFYDTESFALSSKEEKALHPILNSLSETGTRYNNTAFIAEGAEKRISRVYDRQLNRHVAMATPTEASTELDYEHFLREAHLVANLAHPNIIPIHNVGLDGDGIPFYTMELVPGNNLRNILNGLKEGDSRYRSEYSLDRLLDIYLKVCNAIAYAHSRNVLHLDIKPDNIRVGSFGEVFVLDWGLATILIDTEANAPTVAGELDGELLNDITPPNMMKGSVGFMAPEQATVSGKKTQQTDIYALGALLYLMLTHELPVQGNSTTELIENTRAGKITSPRSRSKEGNIPRSLAAVALKALSVQPKDRYGSVIELQNEIQRHLSGYATLAENVNVGSLLVLLMRRHSQSTAMLMVFLLFLAGVIGANLVVVEREKTLAVSARKEAEENLKLYTEQKEKSRKLGEELNLSIMQAAMTDNYCLADEMIPLLEKGLQQNIGDNLRNRLLAQKGTFHYVLQQFSAANECLQNTSYQFHNSNGIRALAKQYAVLKPDDSKSLTTPQLTELIMQSKVYNHKLLYYYLYYHHIQQNPIQNPKEHLALAEILLHRLNMIGKNTPIQSLKLTKVRGKRHLDLSGLPFTIFTLKNINQPSINVLEPLKLYSLDMSNTSLTHLGELKGLYPKELRLIDVNIINKTVFPGQLTRMHLDRVILDRNQYNQKTLNLLKNSMDVIEE